MNKLGVVVLAFFAAMNTASAADFMSADEVKTLFMDKTFDGIYLPKDKNFQVYEAPDGTHNVLRPNGKRDKARTWSVNEKGQHCTTHKKWDGWRCSHVKDAGNGEYHKINNEGDHTHTLTNFRDGNQL